MKRLFNRHMSGVHTLVDGQFGSTGKGVLASYLAREAYAKEYNFGCVISNAGPNSGHTFYHGEKKVVLKQLPTFAVQWAMLDVDNTGPCLPTAYIPVYLTAGAIIDPEILLRECRQFPGMVYVNPNASVITEADRNAEADVGGTVAAVAGTRSGTGMAQARKIMRDPTAVFGDFYYKNQSMFRDTNIQCGNYEIDFESNRVFSEVSQGFSLGINQEFYPKCTSRECTVSQSLSDASLPPTAHAISYMSMRTFPIRVGNVDGFSSGGWYPDQTETTWEKLGVTPELTTVTNRVRRVATFSDTQMLKAIRANDPGVIFFNFMNYLEPWDQDEFRDKVRALTSHKDIELLFGYSHRTEDVR